MCLLFGLGALECLHLRFGQHQALLRHLGFQCFQPVLHGGQVMALPDAANPGRRDREAALGELVGDPELAPGRLVDCHLDHRRLDLGRGTVFQDRLAATHLGKGKFPTFVVHLLEPVEAVAAVAQHLAGLRHVAELLGKLQQPDLGPDDLLFLGHFWSPSRRWAGRGPSPGVRTAPRPPAPLYESQRCLSD
jgi:hypothetical protein